MKKILICSLLLISYSNSIFSQNPLTPNPNDVFNYGNQSFPHYGLGWVTDPWQTGGATSWLSGYGGIKLFTNGTPRLAINLNGNVGIGTTSPLAELHVQGAGDGKVLLGNGGGAYGLFSLNGSLGDWNMASSSGERNLYFNRTSGADMWFGEGHNDWQMALKSGGNLGIGTLSPSTKLEVSGDVNDLLTLTSTHGGGGNTANFYMDTYSSPHHEARIQVIDDNAYAGHLTFSTKVPGAWANGLEERLRITSSGNVGIGTTNPGTFKLAVEGKIGARKVVVTQASSWPDYVFHKSYNLRSLTSLESYIKQNNHLPDVPSAKEVEANGVDLGATQAALLRKIEELTLYVIEQDKRMETQTKEIKHLRKTLQKFIKN